MRCAILARSSLAAARELAAASLPSGSPAHAPPTARVGGAGGADGAGSWSDRSSHTLGSSCGDGDGVRASAREMPTSGAAPLIGAAALAVIGGAEEAAPRARAPVAAAAAVAAVAGGASCATSPTAATKWKTHMSS